MPAIPAGNSASDSFETDAESVTFSLDFDDDSVVENVSKEAQSESDPTKERSILIGFYPYSN